MTKKIRKAPAGAKKSAHRIGKDQAFRVSMDKALTAHSFRGLQNVILDIAKRANVSNSTASVEAIQKIALAASQNCAQFEHAGYIISISSTAPIWDDCAVAYWKKTSVVGDPDDTNICKWYPGDSIIKRVSRAVATIDRLNKKGVK